MQIYEINSTELVFIKKALLLSKKHKFKKHKKHKNRSYVPHPYIPTKSSSEDINQIAYKVFGSLYFNVSED